MKMSVRTSFLSGRPFCPDVRGRRPDVHARPRLPADAVLHADAVKRPRGHVGGNLGETLSFPYKGGRVQYISPTSNQARLNSWDLKWCILHFVFSRLDRWVFGWESTTDGGGGFVVLQDF
jgi:hypothetical protein